MRASGRSLKSILEMKGFSSIVGTGGTVEAVACGPVHGLAEFFVNEDVTTDELAMRSSLSRGSVPGDMVRTITVPTEPLWVTLTRHVWPTTYAFLSIDAEGHDLEVLRSARLDHFQPLVICIEENKDPQIAQFLQGYGYRKNATLGPNGIYVADL